MNPTSLFTNVLSLAPRRDAEARAPSVQDDGPRFELPELPEASSRTLDRHELSFADDRRDLEHERSERDEPDPRAELVMQRGPDELAARGFEEEPGGPTGAPDSDAPDLDANGRPRGTRTSAEAEPNARTDTPNHRRELVGNTTTDTDTANPRVSANASAQAPSAQPHAGQAQSVQPTSTHPQAGQSQAGQGQNAGTGQPQGQQVQAAALQNQAAQTAQVTPLLQGATQATTPVVAQLALAQQDSEAALEVPGGLESKASSSAPEAGGPAGLDALLEAGLDGLGLKLTDRVLGLNSNSALSPGATQPPADLSGEVADAVQRLLADAADESSLLRFRTESGQTFLAQARLEPGQPMELRLLSDDPGVRQMLAERLNDLRSALGRIGFGDAEVQVDRDPSHHGEHSRHPEDRDSSTSSPDELAPRARRPAYGAPETAQSGAGRLHLIL